ncbi:MAG: hypothetical protein IKI72_00445 [Bacteroidales bacterium]|nr:hypothetical protein [Bacteroidales bacterium]
MRKFLSYFLVAFAAVAFCACNEKVDPKEPVPVTPDVPYSSKCQMTKLYLQLAEAEEFANDDYFVQCQQDLTHFSAINQKDVDLNAVVVKFEVSNKAKVYVVDANGNNLSDALVSGESTLNLTKTVYLKVLAENGENKSIYSVDVTSY